MKIELTIKEHVYLRTIIGMDQRLKNERLLNAAASRAGKHFNDPDMDLVDGILRALGNGQLDDLMEQAILQIDIGGLDEAGDKND